MNVTEPAIQLLGAIPVIPAAAGYLAREGVGRTLRRWPYAPLFGRLVAVFVWGAGGLATLTVLGIPTAITIPLAITVAAVVLGTLAVAFAGGLIRPAPVSENVPVG
ncbi:hypothetical protein [Nocardia neocaledoniensis]|uniref:hypothetical protein n=1 Tax=Nocardia neocaledoniensis TaxID=236511 RepID=UPI002458B849|nr:hypothetical protein [Nocardia neocaledoniensis]